MQIHSYQSPIDNNPERENSNKTFSFSMNFLFCVRACQFLFFCYCIAIFMKCDAYKYVNFIPCCYAMSVPEYIGYCFSNLLYICLSVYCSFLPGLVDSSLYSTKNLLFPKPPPFEAYHSIIAMPFFGKPKLDPRTTAFQAFHSSSPRSCGF